MRFLLMLAVMGAWAQTLDQIRQRAIADLASVPNSSCIDSIERAMSIPGQSQFRRLDRVHLELAHIAP